MGAVEKVHRMRLWGEGYRMTNKDGQFPQRTRCIDVDGYTAAGTRRH